MPKRRRTPPTTPAAAAIQPGPASSASAGSTPASSAAAHAVGGSVSPVSSAPSRKRAKRKKETTPAEEEELETPTPTQPAAAAAAVASRPAVTSSSRGRPPAPSKASGRRPSRRRVDGEGDVEMDADTEAAPTNEETPTPATSSHKHPAGPADASPSSASAAAAGGPFAAGAAAAASASSAQAPSSSFQFKCDSNSLSVILSFLNMRDFKSSTRVSRQWRAASSTHIAWPKQSIDSLIASLQADNYDDPNVRRLRIHPDQDNSFDHVEHLLASRSFNQVNDIRFVTSARCTRPKERADAQAAMLDLVKFPYLQTLNLCTTYEHLRREDPGLDQGDDEFVGRFCQAMGGKLRALFLSTPIDGGFMHALSFLFGARLHHLVNLRVLVVDAELPSDTLWQLPHLEFFHGVCEDVGWMLPALRTMSVERALKGVSLACSDVNDDPLMVASLVRALCGQPPLEDEEEFPTIRTSFQPTTKPAQLTTLTLRGFFFETSQLTLLVQHLTTLKYLDLEWWPEDDVWDMRVALPQLETLKLGIYYLFGMDVHPKPFLPPCPTLKSLTLTGSAGCNDLRMSYPWLVTLVTTNFPNVDYLRVGDWKPGTPRDKPNSYINVDSAKGKAKEAAAVAAFLAAGQVESVRLARGCPHPRTIDFDIRPQADIRHLLPAIHQLADFHTLEVTCYPPADAALYGPGGTFSLPSELYAIIASHPTFRTLHVHLSRIHLSRAGGPTLARSNRWEPTGASAPMLPTRELLARLPPKVDRSDVEKRLARFRLHLHREEAGVRVYALQPAKVANPDRLAWVHLEEESDD